MNAFIIVSSMLILLLAVDLIGWNVSICKHAKWLRNNPEAEKRRTVSGLRLYAVAGFSFALPILNIMWWSFAVYLIYVDKSLPAHRFIIAAVVITLSLLGWIHLFAIIARYSCLPRGYWPLISYFVSRGLIKIFKLPKYPE